METAAVDAATGEPMYDTRAGIFIRGEGGFGGDRGPSEPWQAPDRPADHVVTYGRARTRRCCTASPATATRCTPTPGSPGDAGLERPILHGLCTYGFTGRALLHAVCGSDPARFGGMSARFSAPVLPGQTLEVPHLGGRRRLPVPDPRRRPTRTHPRHVHPERAMSDFLAPKATPETAPFWEGAAEGVLRIQQCDVLRAALLLPPPLLPLLPLDRRPVDDGQRPRPAGLLHHQPPADAGHRVPVAGHRHRPARGGARGC